MHYDSKSHFVCNLTFPPSGCRGSIEESYMLLDLSYTFDPLQPLWTTCFHCPIGLLAVPFPGIGFNYPQRIRTSLRLALDLLFSLVIVFSFLSFLSTSANKSVHWKPSCTGSWNLETDPPPPTVPRSKGQSGQKGWVWGPSSSVSAWPTVRLAIPELESWFCFWPSFLPACSK